MSWVFDPDRPLYLQLKEQIKFLIVSGAYEPGYRLPGVRDLAAEASVNPNTLQKALSELEREGLVYAQRTSGRFVTEDTEMISRIRTELALEQVETFLKKMDALGVSIQAAAALIRSKSGEER